MVSSLPPSGPLLDCPLPDAILSLHQGDTTCIELKSVEAWNHRSNGAGLRLRLTSGKLAAKAPTLFCMVGRVDMETALRKVGQKNSGRKHIENYDKENLTWTGCSHLTVSPRNLLKTLGNEAEPVNCFVD